MDPSDDPVIASYDICLTDSEISRYVLQYLDRPAGSSYDDRHGQKPTSFRLKPKTGLVEVDVPINTRVNYDVSKGLRYGDALKKSRSAREGGAFGMAGGFSSGGAGGGAPAKVKMEEAADAKSETASLMRVQTLGGRIKSPEDGDPVYMLAAFRGGEFFPSLLFVGCWSRGKRANVCDFGGNRQIASFACFGCCTATPATSSFGCFG